MQHLHFYSVCSTSYAVAAKFPKPYYEMMIGLISKMYVQLEPTDESKATLLSYQKYLYNDPTHSSILVAPPALHMTIIHIGKVSKTIESLRVATDIKNADIIKNLEKLVVDLEKALKPHKQHQYTLRPTGFNHLGRANNTLVIEYAVTPELKQLHQECLTILKNFFISCGVKNVEAFMEEDANFQYALELRPHITLAKAHTGEIPNILLHTLEAGVMNVLQN
jgi:2'-5' RNA ligase